MFEFCIYIWKQLYIGYVFFNLLFWAKINYAVIIFPEGYEKKGVLFVMIDCAVIRLSYKYWCGWVILFSDGWLKDM